MSTPRDPLEEFLKSAGDDFYKKVEARAREEPDPTDPADLIEWPDPFGVNWAWLHPEQSAPSDDQVTVAGKPTAGAGPHTISKRRRAWTAMAQVAAGFLIGITLFYAFWTGPKTPIAQVPDVTLSSRHATPRGGNLELQVLVESDTAGFVTVISLAPNRPPEVAPDLGEDRVAVGVSGEPTVVTVPRDSTRVLVVVTRTPVDLYFVEWSERAEVKALGPGDADEVRQRTVDLLEALKITAPSVQILDTEPLD